MTASAMIRRRVTVPASTERVWEALTDPSQVSGWFGGEIEWSLEPGGAVSYKGDDGEVREGRIEEIRPGTRLRFVWWQADSAGHADGDRGASEVTYLVQAVPGGSSLTIQETPVRPDGLKASAAALEPPTGWHDWDNRIAGAYISLSARARTGARA